MSSNSEYGSDKIQEKKTKWTKNITLMKKAGHLMSYNIPAVLVKKKNGDYRLCVDYRKLNPITVNGSSISTARKSNNRSTWGREISLFFCASVTQDEFGLSNAPSSF